MQKSVRKNFYFQKEVLTLGTDQRSHNPQTGVDENFSIDEKDERRKVRVKILIRKKRWIWSCSSVQFSSVHFSSVAQSCPTLCNPMNCSMPGLPVHHQLPEFTQTHVHRVSDVIQPSHPLLSPSPPAPNPFQHQSFPMGQLFAFRP